jgi:flagellar biosynthesis protein FlhF
VPAVSQTKSDKKVEYTAAPVAKKQPPVPVPAPVSSRPVTERRYIDIQDDDSEMSPGEGKASLKGAPGQLSGGEPGSGKFEGGRSVNEEVEQLKRLVLELKSAQEDKQDSQLGLGDRQALGREHGLTSPILQEGFELLMLNGIEKRYAVQLLRKAAFELGGKVTDAEQVLDQLAVEILQSVKVLEFPLQRALNGAPAVVCVVGPTGVGKTTTVAKLASLALQKQQDGTALKVGLINLDSYKVAANDQLATYARVLNVPFRAASNAEELRAAMMDFERLDLVILDTAGRSHRDPEALLSMERLIRSIPGVRTQLVVSATTRDAELADTASRFSIFKPEGVSVSKLDEATTYGGLYNLAMRARLPYIFFATGQRVPEDIEAATAERVAALVLDLDI